MKGFTNQELKRILALKDKEHANHELRWYRGISRPLVYDFFIGG